MTTPFAAALFAGGRSVRFGSDKAFHEIDGVPLWKHQIAKLEALMPAEILISANADQEFASEHRVVVDEVADRGPLGALVSCLRATKLSRLLVVAVDLPKMPVGFLGELAYCDCGVIPQHDNGMIEPLVAVYPTKIFANAERCLAEGRLAVREIVAPGIDEGLIIPRPIADAELGFFDNLNRSEKPTRDE